MKQTSLSRPLRRALRLVAALLALTLFPAFSLAAADTAGDADTFYEKVNSAAVTELKLTADIATSRNLSVPQALDLDGKTWTISSGTVTITGGVTPNGGRIVLSGDASLYLMGNVAGAGTIEIGLNARFYNGASAVCTVTGTGMAFRKSAGVPGLNAPGTEIVRTITYADGSVDGGVNGAASGDFWILTTAASGFTAYADVSSVETDAGAYRLNSANATLYRVYAITYDLGGGQLMAANPASYTEADAITLNDPVKQGSRFLGWALGSASAAPATPCTIPQGTTGDLTYYAVWETSGGGSGSASGGYGGLAGLVSGSSGSRTGSSSGAAGGASDTGEDDAAAQPTAAAPAASSPQGGSAARIPSGKSSVKTSLTGGAELEMPAESTVKKAETAFPWALALAAALGLAGLILILLLLKRNSDARMQRLLARLNIRD